MKIGFDAKRLFLNNTGLGNYSRTLVSNLAKYEKENEYFLYSTKIKQTTETKQFLDNINFKTYFPSNTLFPSLWRSFNIIRKLKKDKINIYHGLSNEIPFSLKGRGIKTIVTIHDLIFKVYPETYGFFEKKIYDLKFRYACKNADLIIAISVSTKNDIMRFYGIDAEKITVIYQSCNPIFYKTKTIPNNKPIKDFYSLPEKYILYVGSVEPRKNLKNIILSYTYLNENLKIPLVIVGRGGKYKTEMKKLIHKLNLTEYFFWPENINNIDLKEIYENSEMLIYPSYYEGFGIPIIEALLCNIPVIAANTSSLREAGGPNTLYIDPDEPKQIAEAIEKILQDDLFRENMIKNGKKYVLDKFNPEFLSNQLNICYQRVINKN